MRQAERLGWSSGLRRLGMARSPRALKPAKQLRYAQATTDAAAGGARFATSYARAKANGCAPPAVRVRPDSVRCCGAASREAAPCPVTAAGNSVRSRPCACPASWPMCAFQGQTSSCCCAALEPCGHATLHKIPGTTLLADSHCAVQQPSSGMHALHHSCMPHAQVVLGRTLRPGTRVSWCGPPLAPDNLHPGRYVWLARAHGAGESVMMLGGCIWASASRR